MSADLDNETAVSSLLTEIKPDAAVDDAQYNLVRFLAEDFWLKEWRRWKISTELDGKRSSRSGFLPQTDEEIVAWEIADDKSTTAVWEDESNEKGDIAVKCFHKHFVTTIQKAGSKIAWVKVHLLGM